MESRIAKITDTFLGREDHGIFTTMLSLDYGGSSQGAGGYALDEYTKPVERRVGTAQGLDFIIRTMDACGVDSWERIKGRTVIAIIDDGMVRGIKPLPTEPGTPFMFADAFPKKGEPSCQ